MEFRVHDRAVYLPASGTLVFADLHVGRDAASEIELPLGEDKELTSRFEALLARYEPSNVVVAGDLLHSFDRIPTDAADTVRALKGLADDADCRIAVVSGNHDTMLEELWDGTIAPEHPLPNGSLVVTHGHVPPKTDAEWYVVGHDHPTLEIEGVRHPCYLHGAEQYQGAGVFMLPSFSRLPAGVRINGMTAASFQSPLITDAKALRPIVHDADGGETHFFPPLGELRPYL